MKKYFFLPAFFLTAFWAWAQTDSVMHISLNDYVKDERFDKYQLTLALFLTQGDTIYSMDFEGTRPAVPIKIKKPDNCKTCAYGNVFFSGTSNSFNPGYVSVVVCNPYNKNPKLFIDQNQNFDFGDDSSYMLPYYEEKPLEIELSNALLPEGKMKIVLTKNMLFGQKYEFKKYMDEYYEMAYKGRKFI